MTTRRLPVKFTCPSDCLFVTCCAVLFLYGGQTDIRVALCVNEFHKLSLHIESKLVTGGDAVKVYEVNWMLVVLG